jgi:pilus assembly protein Flp/PilA
MLAYCCVLLERLRNDRKGVTALEYGVIAAVTVAAVAGTIGLVGTQLGNTWNTISNAL